MTDSTESLVLAMPHHVGVVVADLEAQRRWYQRAFGLTQFTGHQPSPTVRTALLRAPNGLRLELVERAGSRRDHHFGNPMDAAQVQGYNHWAVQVSDVDQAFAALLGVGATSALPPTAGPDGARFAYVMDPEENLIELIQH